MLSWERKSTEPKKDPGENKKGAKKEKNPLNVWGPYKLSRSSNKETSSSWQKQ